MLSGTYRCDNCGYEPESEEVKRSFLETLKADSSSDSGYSRERAVEMANQMDQEIDPNSLITPIHHSLESPMSYLDEGEVMKYLVKGIDVDIDGNDVGHRNYTIVSDKRIIIATAGLLGKSTEHSISYHNVTDISVGGRITTQLEIRTAGHTYEITGFDAEVSEACFSYIRQQVEKGGSKSVPSDDADPVRKLEKLAELKDKGVISNDEFESKKRELLDEI